MQNEFLVIVHGIGDGILRKTTHLFLAKNPKIKQYKLCSFNVGCTFSTCRFDKNKKKCYNICQQRRKLFLL